MRLALVAGAALVLTACGSTTTPTDPGPGTQVVTAGIYVTTAANTVLVFPLSASGNVAPARTIAGTNTGLALPIGIGVDSKGSIYVANRTGSKVTVYPLGATGNVAPTRTMTDTAMKSPQALFIDSGDGVFVATCPGCGQAAGGATGMYHFPNGANAIDYFIRGANTGMTVPVGVGLDATRNVYVANAFGGTMNVYAPGASGNTLPIRSFSPGAGQNIQSQFVTANTILLASPGSGIVSYINTAIAGTLPSTTIPSSSTLPISYPGGMYLDTSVPQPVLYLVDFGAGAIHIIQTTGTAPNLGVLSVVTIKGAATGLQQPLGITVRH
jgi:hypothetical protein